MEKQIVSNKQFELMIERLVYQLIENHSNFLETVIIGVQPRGVELSNRILEKIKKITNNQNLQSGSLDITFLETTLEEENVLLKHKNWI